MWKARAERRRAGDPAASGPTPVERLRERALRLVARREYAERELERRLVTAGGEPETVRVLLAELRAAGYLSDQRFAESAVRRQQGRYSRRFISESLKSSGVGREVADDALAAIEHDDLSAAQALWQRRFGQPPVDERDKARQIRFLLARGFSTALALRVLRAAGTSIDDAQG